LNEFQVIHAQDISESLQTFGYSFAGGFDIDDNGYPDLLIGSYESNNAVLLRYVLYSKIYVSIYV